MTNVTLDPDLVRLVAAPAVSLALCWILTAYTIRLASRGMAETRAGRARRPALRGFGGVPVFVSCVAAVGAIFVLDGRGDPGSDGWTPLLPVLCGGVLMLLTGVRDDYRPLEPTTKLLCQAVAAAVAISLGAYIEDVPLLGAGAWQTWLVGMPVSFVLLVGITNSFNLIDGLDGLATGIGVITAVSLAALSLGSAQTEHALLLLSLAGSLLGSARYNVGPARIYLGDSGSLFVGFCLVSSLVCSWRHEGEPFGVLVAVLLFAIPVVDTGICIARRVHEGWKLGDRRRERRWAAAIRRVLKGDGGHVHHRLVEKGLSVRGAVLTLWTASLASCLLLLSLVTSGSANRVAVLMSLGLLTLITVWKLDYLRAPLLPVARLLGWYATWRANKLACLRLFDAAVAAAAFLVSWSLLSAAGTRWSWPDIGWIGLIHVCAQLVALQLLQVYRGTWKFFTTRDWVRLFAAIPLGLSLSTALASPWLATMPVSLYFVLNLSLLTVLQLLGRGAYQLLVYLDEPRLEGDRGSLVVGANPVGQLVARQLLAGEASWRPLGFLDEDPLLREREVAGLPVLGSVRDLPRIVSERSVDSVVLVGDRTDRRDLTALIDICQRLGIRVVQQRWEPVEVPSDRGGLRGRPGTRSRGPDSGPHESASDLRPFASGGRAPSGSPGQVSERSRTSNTKSVAPWRR